MPAERHAVECGAVAERQARHAVRLALPADHFANGIEPSHFRKQIARDERVRRQGLFVLVTQDLTGCEALARRRGERQAANL